MVVVSTIAWGATKFVSSQVNSDFLDTFLQNNLIVLLPALLAINVTTLSIMLTKIDDLKKAYKQVSFKGVIQGMKQSVLEQVILIVLAVIILILRSSKNIPFLLSPEGQKHYEYNPDYVCSRRPTNCYRYCKCIV